MCVYRVVGKVLGCGTKSSAAAEIDCCLRDFNYFTPQILQCTLHNVQPFSDPLLLSSPLSASSRQRCPQAAGLEGIAPLVTSVQETPDPIPTTIRGTVPSWINGSFLRNGPGKFEFGQDRYLRSTRKKKQELASIVILAAL